MLQLSSPTQYVFRGLVLMWWLWWIPLGVSAQEVPVTIVPLFPEERPLGAGCVPQSPLCTPARNSFVLFNEVVLPSIETKREKRRDVRQAPRAFGAKVRYEHLAVDRQLSLDLAGDIYSITLRQTWQEEDFEFGVLLPYDFLHLKSLDAHRVGLIAFGQYTYPVSRSQTLHLTVNGNYTHTAIEQGILEDVNTLGGGISLAWALEHEWLEVRGAGSYQFHADARNRGNNQQHLLKMGGTVGFRLGEALAFKFFGLWNYDATAYKTVFIDVDNNYGDVGIEAVWSPTDFVHVVGGYKKVLGLKHFDSNMVFVGALVRF